MQRTDTYNLKLAEFSDPDCKPLASMGLEQLGLAERIAKPGDRRVYQVRVTDAGRSLREKGRRKRLARLVQFPGSATPGELRALQSGAIYQSRRMQRGVLIAATSETYLAQSVIHKE